jgi:hypothetical protein
MPYSLKPVYAHLPGMFACPKSKSTATHKQELIDESNVPTHLKLNVIIKQYLKNIENAVSSMALQAHSGPWPFIQFRNHFSQMIGLLGQEISWSPDLYLNAEQYIHRINGYTHQTSMSKWDSNPRSQLPS